MMSGSRQVVLSWAPMPRHGFDFRRMQKLFAAPWPICLALSPSAHDTRAFILLHSLQFFFLDFVIGYLALTGFKTLTKKI